jgi:UDPglucose 6-dehydrogenase
MRPDGSCDISIVFDVCSQISKADYIDALPVVVIKSTIPPGTTDCLQAQFPELHLVFNPEFLTEANFAEDFKNQDHIVLGGCSEGAMNHVAHAYELALPQALVVFTKPTEAELLKYVANCFLALKVSFSNEVYDLCKELDASHDCVMQLVRLDPRLGKSHWQVPGPDGQRGYSGSCFPKDVNALIAVGYGLGVDFKTLKASWDVNLRVRPSRDWELLKGRAVC